MTFGVFLFFCETSPGVLWKRLRIHTLCLKLEFWNLSDRQFTRSANLSAMIEWIRMKLVKYMYSGSENLVSKFRNVVALFVLCDYNLVTPAQAVTNRPSNLGLSMWICLSVCTKYTQQSPMWPYLQCVCVCACSPEMVVGWYHSHPGFGCWLSGVDINTQQSFEALSERAVAVVVHPIQSVRGKVVIDAFRLIPTNTLMMAQEPRQTTSNLGHLQKPSIQVCSAHASASQHSPHSTQHSTLDGLLYFPITYPHS